MQNLNELLLLEDNFQEKIETLVSPFLKQIEKKGNFLTTKSETIHYEYYKHPQEKGAIVISHGFCEFTKKYKEVIYYFYQVGYSVYIMDHCGHGYSTRRVADKSLVHISSYDDYVSSFHTFISEIVLKNNASRFLILFAHSMGGAISALYLEAHPSIFHCAIFSSPMLEINYGKTPYPFIWLWMTYKRLRKHDQEYILGNKPFDKTPYFEESSCVSKARFDYIFSMRLADENFQTFGGSYAWAHASIKALKQLQKNASKVSTNILLFQAGRDTTVKPGGQIRFAKKSKQTRLCILSESKHEIFNADYETRKTYYQEIFHFLEQI